MDVKQNLEQKFNTPEIISSPDAASHSSEQAAIEKVARNVANEAVAAAPAPTLQATTPAPTNIADDQISVQKVEEIMTQDMEKVYLSLDLATQAKFKTKGEAVALEITNLLQKGKLQIKKVLALIIDWLRIIPHVNKYYLEQEAKLKADAIMRLYKK